MEHIYHRARLDAEMGLELWQRELDQALAIGRFDRCRSLLSMLGELEMPSEAAARASTYQVTRAEIALGRWDEAEQRLYQLPPESPHALLLRAHLAFVKGDFAAAERLSGDALETSPPGTARLPFLLMAAELMLFLGRFDEGRDLCREALASVESGGFGSLYVRCPEIDVPSAERIAAALLAFAAGDGLGVPWEGTPPGDIDRSAIRTVPPAPWGWPRGATSDDTAQMLLVARLLADTGGRPTPEAFMARLADAADEIRGIGPTTQRALDHFRATGSLPSPDPGQRATNGAAMRMLPVGWTTPVADPDRRRELTRVLAIGTHQAPASIGAACVVTAMAAWAIEGVGTDTVLAAARSEAEWVAQHHAELPAVMAALDGRWAPSGKGIGLEADETVAAVVHVLRSADNLGSALLLAVTLGGDTDTVAALVGGIARAPGRPSSSTSSTGCDWWTSSPAPTSPRGCTSCGAERTGDEAPGWRVMAGRRACGRSRSASWQRQSGPGPVRLPCWRERESRGRRE